MKDKRTVEELKLAMKSEDRDTAVIAGISYLQRVGTPIEEIDYFQFKDGKMKAVKLDGGTVDLSCSKAQ